MQETQETRVQSLCWEGPLEKEMATHCSILAGNIPWKEKPGWLQSVGSQSRTQLSMRASMVSLWSGKLIDNKKDKVLVEIKCGSVLTEFC